MKNIGKEVIINGREGEITRILGTEYYEITFFNVNDGKVTMPRKDIEKYLTKEDGDQTEVINLSQEKFVKIGNDNGRISKNNKFIPKINYESIEEIAKELEKEI